MGSMRRTAAAEEEAPVPAAAAAAVAVAAAAVSALLPPPPRLLLLPNVRYPAPSDATESLSKTDPSCSSCSSSLDCAPAFKMELNTCGRDGMHTECSKDCDDDADADTAAAAAIAIPRLPAAAALGAITCDDTPLSGPRGMLKYHWVTEASIASAVAVVICTSEA